MSEALAYLGLETLRGLMVMLEVFSTSNLIESELNALWYHSLKVATLAKRIARQEGFSAKQQEQAFITGMLMHDFQLVSVREKSFQD